MPFLVNLFGQSQPKLAYVLEFCWGMKKCLAQGIKQLVGLLLVMIQVTLGVWQRMWWIVLGKLQEGRCGAGNEPAPWRQR